MSNSKYEQHFSPYTLWYPNICAKNLLCFRPLSELPVVAHWPLLKLSSWKQRAVFKFREKIFQWIFSNIILASFLDDFNFLKACSSPKTMSCGVQGGPWTRRTWNFLTSRSRKEGKGLGFVIPRNFRETHLNTPLGSTKIVNFQKQPNP